MKRKTIHILSLLIMSACVIFGMLTATVVNADDAFTVTFHSGTDGGAFEGGSTTNVMEYAIVPSALEKYSHTQNVDDTGRRNSYYGNYWGNANVSGTDRGDTSKAHVVTIPGATTLNVEMYFNGDSVNNDWSSVWAGSYPKYNAYNYYSTGKVTTAMGAPNSTNKFGGTSLSGVTFGTYTINGNTYPSMGHVTLTIPGDTATFSFTSNYTGYGGYNIGYGYYAIITGTDSNGVAIPDPVKTELSIVSGEYKEPSGYEVDDTPYRFLAWYDNPELTGDPVDISSLSETIDLYAAYEENIMASGTFGCPWRILKDGSLEIGKEGQSCVLDTDSVMEKDEWPWHSNRSKITSVKINGNVSLNEASSTSSMFSEMAKVTSIDLNGLDTSNSTRFDEMFYNCQNLTSLDLGENFDTSNGTSFNGMFYLCKSLVSLELGDKFDTRKCTNFGNMFYGCYELEALDLRDKFDTSNGTDFYQMFYTCSSLTSLDLGDKFDTSKGTSFNGMFWDCRNLESLDLGENFDTSNGTTFSNMFSTCQSLESLDLGDKFDTSNGANFTSMFSNCNALTSLDLGDKFNTSKGTDFGDMFYNCSSLTSLDLGDKFDTSKGEYFRNMFSSCDILASLDLGDKFDTSNVQSYGLYSMFSNCKKLTSLDLGDKFTPYNTPNIKNTIWSGCTSLKTLRLGNSFDTSSWTNFREMFSGLTALETIDFGPAFTTENGTSFYYMFYNCKSLQSLTLDDGFDTSKGTDFSYMFGECASLSELTLGDKFDTSNGTNFNSMFQGCRSFTTMDFIDKLDTSNGTNFSTMFTYCTSLEHLELGDKFDVSNATGLSSMFSNCTSLVSLDLGNKFDTSNVTTLAYMFQNCSSLTSLDLGDKFDTGKTSNLYNMFDGCSSLTALDLGDQFDTSGATFFGEMFKNCSSLTSLDLGDKFDTSKARGSEKMFDGMTSLKSIILPEVFSFKGTSTTTSYQALLPNPQLPSRTWMRVYDLNTMQALKGDDRTKLSAEQLRDTWDGSTMAGLWVWDQVDPSSIGYGDETTQHSVDSKWNVLSEDTWEYTFNVFDDTLQYYLTEDPIPGFISDIDPSTGYIEIHDKVGEITNRTTTELGSLTVRKTVSGIETADKFDFTITLAGRGIPADGTKTIDGVVFTNGVGHIQLRNGESKTLANIPEGVTYTITEDNVSDRYTVSSANETGAIVKEGNIAVFNNTYTYIENPTPSVPIILKKEVSGDSDIDVDQEYEFVARFTGLEKNQEYTLTKPNSTEDFTSDDNGYANLTIRLKKNEICTFEDIPVGAIYQFSEMPGDWIAEYEVKNNTASGTISNEKNKNLHKDETLSTAKETAEADEETQVTFKNTYEDKESIVIRKEVSGDPEDESKFEFNIKFTDMNEGETIETEIGRFIADEDGTAEKDFYLAAGDELVIENIPVGVKYQIKEAASLYKASYAITDEGDAYPTPRIAKASDENNVVDKALSTAVETVDKGESITVLFTNSKDTGSLKVGKTGTDAVNATDEFPIDITLTGSRFGVSGDYQYSGSKEGVITFDKNGKGRVMLRKGEEITIANVPIGTKYTVEEYDPEETYVKTYSGETGTITNSTASALIRNNPKTNSSDLSVSKTVAGTMGNKFKAFEFTITLSDGSDPVFGTFNVEGISERTLTFDSEGKASFTLKHGQTLVIKNLPVGATYTVSEKDYVKDGYTTTSAHPTGTIDATASNNSVSFINTRNVSIPTSAHMSFGFLAVTIIAAVGIGMLLSKKKKGGAN